MSVGERGGMCGGYDRISVQLSDTPTEDWQADMSLNAKRLTRLDSSAGLTARIADEYKCRTKHLKW